MASVAPASAADHFFSSLAPENCRVLRRDLSGEIADEECEGILGYSLVKHTQNSRDTLAIVHDGEKRSLNFSAFLTDHLNHLGNQVEWRLNEGDIVALIFHLYLTVPKTDFPIERYVVAKLQPSEFCVVQMIDAKEEDAADHAEELADHAASTECLQ